MLDKESPIYLIPAEGSRSFTNFSFYSLLLEQLSEHYSKSKDKPILSFEMLEWIEPSVLPNLIGLGLYLKQFHNGMIDLRLKYNPKLLKYLDDVGFFKLIGEKSSFSPNALEVFNFDPGFLGGYSSYDIKDTREDHKIRCYAPRNAYNILTEENKKEEYRDGLIEELETYVLPNHFSEILFDKEITGDNIYASIERLAEPISNGILHSGSSTIVMMQTTKFNTKISISDIGRGFEKSFLDKKLNFDLVDVVKGKGLYQKNLHDFYMILQIMLYSMTKIRTGLLDFIIDVVVINKGTVRMHYNSTQIILTTAFRTELIEIDDKRKAILNYRLENPNQEYKDVYRKGLESLVKLGCKIKDNYRKDLKLSPLRLYKVKLQGIHIEIDLI